MQALKWWQKGVFYQIYPRSFADSNEDGIGDLKGIINKLDYLKNLGIEAIWLSPHYPSPLYDCGYDIADYQGVAPEYGTLADFQRFLEEAHRRDLRVVLDLVLNHTSDQHPWFIESRSSLDNPKRDWYIWRAGKANDPPNNWYSSFGGSAWEYDDLTGQYYYHYFFKQQPDLNWRNSEVKAAMFQVIRYWLDMGVDGYRLDAIGTLFEDPDLIDQPSKLNQAELYKLSRTANNPADKAQVRDYMKEMFVLQHDLPESHYLMREIRLLCNEYDDRVLIGETDELSYCGTGEDELHMVFNFPLMLLDRLDPDWIRANQINRLACLPPGSWPGNTLDNHDIGRVFSRYSDGQHDQELARISIALMLTLRGTPFLYYGEEIGMTDLLLPRLSDFRDQLGIWAYHIERDVLGASHPIAEKYAAQFGRDKNRTPMQWENVPNAGFCPPGTEPWLPVNPNFSNRVNVADQNSDPASLFSFYRSLLKLRQQTPALIAGEYIQIAEESKNQLSFLRSVGEQNCLVILNISDQPGKLGFNLSYKKAKVLFSNRERQDEMDDLFMVEVAPYEIYIAELIN